MFGAVVTGQQVPPRDKQERKKERKKEIFNNFFFGLGGVVFLFF